MKINKPYLFIELNDKKFIFLIVEYNEDLDFKILDATEVFAEGILNGKIININIVSNIIKKNLILIEKKIGFIFNEATIISDQNNFECLNISGYKRLSGSQILKEDISYIINNIKKSILENKTYKNLIHLFNSDFFLDGQKLKNIPIGLYGDFYNQHLTFFLLSRNDTKNIKLTLNKCDINIERIILKPFAHAIDIINKNKINENFFVVNIKKNRSSISHINNKSFIYHEDFSFGSDIIIRDIEKLISLNFDSINKILSEIKLDVIDSSQKEYLNKKYFSDTVFRKVSIKHLNEIINARLDEMIDLIFKNNVNLGYKQNSSSLIYTIFEDQNIMRALKARFFQYLPGNRILFNASEAQDEHLSACIGSAELIGRGWEKEALPVIQTKKSTISRIFSTFFD
tara:strand:- start:3309 stop:4508 length:1200 start_codon:yes stop_codon:yes gene_type:complete